METEVNSQQFTYLVFLIGWWCHIRSIHKTLAVSGDSIERSSAAHYWHCCWSVVMMA